MRTADLPAEEKIAGGTLYFARRLNGELNMIFSNEMLDSYDQWSFFGLSLIKYGEKVGTLLQKRSWRKVDGTQIKGQPFEVKMAGVMLLSAAWVFDIFSRKARDRKAPEMATELERLEGLLNELLRYVKDRVASKKGQYAFNRYVADLYKYRQVETLIELGLVTPLPWWRRWWYKRFGIPNSVSWKP